MKALRFQGVYRFEFNEWPPGNLDRHPIFSKWFPYSRRMLKSAAEAKVFQCVMKEAVIPSGWKGLDIPQAERNVFTGVMTNDLLKNDMFLLTNDAEGQHADQYESLMVASRNPLASKLEEFRNYKAQLPELALRNDPIKVDYEAVYPNKSDYDPKANVPYFMIWLKEIEKRDEIKIKEWEITSPPPVRMLKNKPYDASGKLDPFRIHFIGPSQAL